MKTITILQHNVEYWYDNDQDMPEHEEEHVAGMIAQGYSQGELNDEQDAADGNSIDQNRGWWKINNS